MTGYINAQSATRSLLKYIGNASTAWEYRPPSQWLLCLSWWVWFLAWYGFRTLSNYVYACFNSPMGLASARSSHLIRTAVDSCWRNIQIWTSLWKINQRWIMQMQNSCNIAERFWCFERFFLIFCQRLITIF